MKKIELLSPAGNMQSFYAALYAGADAVYLGGKNFGARALSQNFTNEELKQVINYAHIYDVKVYVTINTTIYENELNDVIDYIEFLYLNNVDAIIVQDLGLVSMVKEKFPNLEIHASTQMNTHNKETLKLLKNLGIKRVVLAREVSLNEINKMDVDIEKEIFIHGALCMSYSGECLLSSVIGGRSGNRGLCAGPCRLEYKLLEKNINGKEKIINTNGKYLLSTKDLCTIDRLDEILKSDVNSLKIEGRMKSVEYVYLVTSIYRKAIDNYYKYGKTNINKIDIKNLKVLFNRDFTNGFLFNEQKDKINNSIRPNHMGINLGKVIDKNKNRVKIKLIDNLNIKDGIRIISNNDYGFIVSKIFKNGKVVDKAFKNNVIELIVDNNIKINSNVVKTLDIEQIKYVEEKIKQKRRIDIKMYLVGKLGEKLKLTVEDNKNKIEVLSDMETFKAEKLLLTKERIKEQLGKLNDTPFNLTKINIDIDDNILIPIKELNNIRRKAVSKLIELRINRSNEKIIKDLPKIESKKYNDKININCFVKNEEQLLCCIENKVDNIYVEENLYNKYKNKYNNLILTLPRIMKNPKKYNNEKLLVRNLGEINYKDKNELYIDYTLNVTNSMSVNLFNKYNPKLITLSEEITDDTLYNITKTLSKNNNLELIIYGNIEVFISKYCILNKHVNKNKICDVCKNNNTYFLIDRKGEKYQITKEEGCGTILLSSKKINKLDKYNYYKNIGYSNFRLHFFNENKYEISKILKNLK